MLIKRQDSKTHIRRNKMRDSIFETRSLANSNWLDEILSLIGRIQIWNSRIEPFKDTAW